MLFQSHPYCSTFKHAYETLRDYPDASHANIRLRIMPGQDQRQYNLPMMDEVAVILPGDGTAPDRRDIVLHPRHADRSYTRVDDRNPAYASLHYVLLFPNGNHRWHWDLLHNLPPGVQALQNWNAP
jgi:hypothetical protein